MGNLSSLVDIVHNDFNSVVFQVKDGKELDLIKTGFFNGDEKMFRVTKGNNIAYTFWMKDGRHYTHERDEMMTSHGRSKINLISKMTIWDFGINLSDGIDKTCFIQKLNDQFKRDFEIKLMGWFSEDYNARKIDLSVHRDGNFISFYHHNQNEFEGFLKSIYPNAKYTLTKGKGNTKCDVWTFHFKKETY